MTRDLYALINAVVYWSHMLDLPSEAMEELRFWTEQISNFNGQNIIMA